MLTLPAMVTFDTYSLSPPSLDGADSYHTATSGNERSRTDPSALAGLGALSMRPKQTNDRSAARNDQIMGLGLPSNHLHTPQVRTTRNCCSESSHCSVSFPRSRSCRSQMNRR